VPSEDTNDKYFPYVYYTTLIFNEAYFGLLLLIGIVVNKFVKARFRRANVSLSPNSSQMILTRSNSETTMYMKQVSSPQSGNSQNVIAESRGEKPQARESFLQKENLRLRYRRSMIQDASTATGLLHN
jgi:cytochrome c biogenesis factor